MVKPIATPEDSQSLRKVLHERIEQLDASKLSLLNRVMLQLEAEELASNLDAEFDQDRREGKITPERVQQVISQIRAEHPYQ